MSKFTLSKVNVIDCAKLSDPINTGIGFFDHMLDQLNSHAQIGISVTVESKETNGSTDFSNHNRHAEPMEGQAEIVSLVGEAIGSQIRALIESKSKNGKAKRSRFCCPLDEALVECILSSVDENNGSTAGLSTFALAPYGTFPRGGRTKIGTWGTVHVQTFFQALSTAMNVNLSLIKIRGDNGHHVVESAFKAFSRALRNYLDGVDIDDDDFDENENMEALWGDDSQSFLLGTEMKRQAKIDRCTKETSILVDAKLFPLDSNNKSDEQDIDYDNLENMTDEKEDDIDNDMEMVEEEHTIVIDTGIEMLDKIFTIIATQTDMQLEIKCKGDLHVDDHHSAEDVAIAFGQVLNKALGTKAGLNRMWLGKAKVGDCEVEVTMDLSNRPCLTSNLSLETISPTNEEMVKGLSVEMIDHAFDSIVMNGQMTVHIVEKTSKSSITALEDLTIATSRAFGRALKMCMAVDPRRKGATASSKGTLSV